ncbi:trace amine-associated receptor 13c-like [Pholidichthys leucotaenia]
MDNQNTFCFPELLNTSCKKPTLHWSEAVLLNILLSSISVITVVLNLLIIISISHYRQLHTPTNILLLSLAVSDFLVGLLSMPGEIFRKTACWFLGDLMCSLYNYVMLTITSASIGTIVLISVDRYVAICAPLHYPTRVTLARGKFCVCLCWLCSVFYISLLVKDELADPGRRKSCYGECVITIGLIESFVDLILTFIIPVSVILILYMRIFVVAVSQARAMRSHVKGVTHLHSVTLTAKRSELKAARTLSVLVIMFLICFCPFYIVSLAGYETLSISAEFYILHLFTFNSCINPVIYALFYPWFRRSIKLIVTLQILQPGSCEANVL